MFEHTRPAFERDALSVGEALVIFDPLSGSMSYVNDAAAELFELRDDRLPELRITDLLPECVDPAVSSFTTTVRSGKAESKVAVRLERLSGATYQRFAAMLAIATVLETTPLVIEHRRDAPAGDLASEPDSDGEFDATPEAALMGGASREMGLERLGALWKLVVRRGLGGSENVRALLAEGTRAMRMENATLARVEGKELVVDFAEPPEMAGTRTALDRSFARSALRRSGTFAVLDAREDGELAALALGMRSFLSSAFRIGDTTWVLTFSSVRPRESTFESEDWRYVDDLIEALSRSIERGESDARVERLAYSDALTSLPNRIALLARLDDAIAEADALRGRVAVLFLDIDGFKGVNDTVGHRGGDTVLAEVAQRLRGTLRREEYIGRLGGDEFAIVMPRVADRTEIESIAQRIAGVLTFPFGVEDYRFSLSASIGVAIYPDDAAERDDLLACADAAMYTAKDDGGSRIRFRDVAGSFDEGPVVAGDTGYVLCYQPVVDLASDRVLSVEALIRRVHPLHGLLAPERGWSIARDENGRRALDRWVLREATSQARALAASGLPLRVDVNLAAFDVREIDRLLDDTEFAADARRLGIEISPSQFADPQEGGRIRAFVQHFSERGIAFTLDGFDGHLETLSSVTSLPIDVIKLDRPMVEGIATSRTARAIVEGAMVVARSLGWSVVAKGVETAAQREALASLGCNNVQGFFVAHPMTAVELGSWLRERHYAGREA
jgi:diguanylate cyclase (GGDEF)-like protein